MAEKELKSIHPKTRQHWRQWLEKNHNASDGVWMIYYKQETGKRKFSMVEAVEEALCFGWIDSVANKVDDERSKQKFTPRKSKSAWSQINKTRVKVLTEKGLMTAAGLKAIEMAKKTGTWDALNASDFHAENKSLPDDLEKAFNSNKKALINFENFSVSNRKRFLSWIDSARQAETRTTRIKQTVLMAAANKKPDAKGFKL